MLPKVWLDAYDCLKIIRWNRRIVNSNFLVGQQETSKMKSPDRCFIIATDQIYDNFEQNALHWQK